MAFSEVKEKFFNKTTLERVLREKSIGQITKYTKILLYCAWFVVVVYGIRGVVYEWLCRENEVGKMQNAISVNLARLDASADVVVTKKKVDHKRIVKQAIFGSKENYSTFNRQIPRPTPTPVSKRKNDTVYELHGVFLWGDSTPTALIADSKKAMSEKLVELNAFIDDDAPDGESSVKLVGVFKDRVEIDRDGTREFLYIDSASDDSDDNASRPGAIVVDEKEIDKALSNLPLLLQQARSAPYFKDGKPVGIRLFAIRPGSLYEKIGLKDGDILKEINGTNLTDITKAIKLFEKLKTEKDITVRLEREHVEKVLNYTIR